MSRATAIIVAVALVSAACRQTSGPGEQLNELARTRSGNLDVVLLSSDAAVNTGKDTVTIEFRSASDGRLVEVGSVKANARMPMASMAPMLGPVVIERSPEPGRYVATTELSMAGEWRLSLEWNGPAGQGSVTFSPMVN